MKKNGIDRWTMLLSSTLFLFPLSAMSRSAPPAPDTETAKTAVTTPATTAPGPTQTAPAPAPTAEAKVLSTTEIKDQENLFLLSRELPKSSDQVFGTKKKGLCGKTADELGQLQQALRAELDERELEVTGSEPVLKKNKTCGADCQKNLCASETFKKLDTEKANYGTAKDGT